jgi:uncharacterized membrane protein YhdT
LTNYTAVRINFTGVRFFDGGLWMNLKSARWTLWLTTTLFCAAMAVSAVLYLTNAGFKERFAHLGFPSYFRVELAVFKLAGVFALLLPARFPMKEWAYAGFSSP